MPNLRDMLDANTIYAGPPVAKNPSPAAKHVTDHMDDPMGSTKEGFTDLTQKKLQYDTARENMQRQLSMPQAVINHVSQVHGLQPNTGMMNEQGTPGMGNPDDPNAQTDDQGNPLPQGAQGGMPGSMPGAAPTGTPGMMPKPVGTNSRPPLAGQPGQAPGPAQSAMPPKLGVPSPGKQGMTPKGSPMGQPKVAAKPAGAGKAMPKAPGSGAVQNRAKKAQDNSARQIKVHVTASSGNEILQGSSQNIHSHSGMETLRSGSVAAGLAAINEKSTETGNESAYNPVVRAGDTYCKECNKFHPKGKHIKAGSRGSGHHGTPFGSSSAKERDAHRTAAKAVKKMKGGGLGSGRHSSGAVKLMDKKSIHKLNRDVGNGRATLSDNAYKMLVKRLGELHPNPQNR